MFWGQTGNPAKQKILQQVPWNIPAEAAPPVVPSLSLFYFKHLYIPEFPPKSMQKITIKIKQQQQKMHQTIFLKIPLQFHGNSSKGQDDTVQQQ